MITLGASLTATVSSASSVGAENDNQLFKNKKKVNSEE